MSESTPTSTPAAAPAPEGTAPYGTGAQAAPQRRVRIPHLLQMKERGEKWAMLTAYDMYTAEIFDEAGIPVLLVGDSAGNNVYGFETTVPVTVDHLVPLCRAVTSAAKHAMVVADLPFGSYQASPQQALATATRFMKEGMAHAVKLEGGKPMVPEVELLVRAGIPVMGHIGFTPQSEHVLGGYKVQGRGAGADKLMEGDFSYNVSEWKPKVSYDVSGQEGELIVKQGGANEDVRLGGDARNEWDISMNDEVPTDLVVRLGAGESDLDLDSLTLTGVDVRMGAGKSTVDLTGDYAKGFDATIEGGVGEATVLLPSGVGVKAKAEGGLGKINAEGLKKVGDSYANDAYGESDVNLSVDVKGGVGEINLEVV